MTNNDNNIAGQQELTFIVNVYAPIKLVEQQIHKCLDDNIISDPKKNGYFTMIRILLVDTKNNIEEDAPQILEKTVIVENTEDTDDMDFSEEPSSKEQEKERVNKKLNHFEKQHYKRLGNYRLEEDTAKLKRLVELKPFLVTIPKIKLTHQNTPIKSLMTQVKNLVLRIEAYEALPLLDKPVVNLKTEGILDVYKKIVITYLNSKKKTMFYIKTQTVILNYTNRHIFLSEGSKNKIKRHIGFSESETRNMKIYLNMEKDQKPSSNRERTETENPKKA